MRLAPPYSAFAAIYDRTMAEVPYQNWAAEIVRILRAYHIASNETILDIGCGTGELIRLIQPLYPRVCGLDNSISMLQCARGKKIRHLLLADMEHLPLRPATAGAMICTHDAINYLKNREALVRHFNSVSCILRPGGIYLFDSSSERNVVHNYHGKEFREKHGKTELHWSNNYDPKTRIIISKLIFQSGSQSITEEHRQQIFTPREIRTALSQAGLTIVDEFSDYRCGRGATRLHCYLAYK